PSLIVPRPLAGPVAKAQHGGSIARFFDLPRMEPTLAVQRARIAGHVRREPDFATAEGESAAPDAVHVGHEREARGVQHVSAPAVAFAQYRCRRSVPSPFKR